MSRSSDSRSQSQSQSQSESQSDSPSQVSDYFGTFLESVKQASPEYPDQAPTSSATTGAATGQDATLEPSSTISAITILATLASKGPAMPLVDLLATLGISWMQAGSILSPLVESNFVSISGDPGSEMVQLTEDGARLTTGVV